MRSGNLPGSGYPGGLAFTVPASWRITRFAGARATVVDGKTIHGR
jgi:hypothetical protein